MDLADLADLLLFEAPDFRHIPNRSGEESVNYRPLKRAACI